MLWFVLKYVLVDWLGRGESIYFLGRSCWRSRRTYRQVGIGFRFCRSLGLVCRYCRFFLLNFEGSEKGVGWDIIGDRLFSRVYQIKVFLGDGVLGFLDILQDGEDFEYLVGIFYFRRGSVFLQIIVVFSIIIFFFLLQWVSVGRFFLFVFKGSLGVV